MVPEINPHPFALIEAMRSIGYRPHTAIADLVDNSIAASARMIEVDVHPSEGPLKGWVTVQDDGKGMTETELLKAMRWGGDGPQQKRKQSDLGRFGLGMKTASFSLGRRLTVLTRKRGTTSILRWDLDHVENVGRWELLKGLSPSDQQDHTAAILKKLENNESGTCVLVTNIDTLRVDGHSLQNRDANRTRLLGSIKDHLGLVFHRFLGRRKVKIKLGTTTIPFWNLMGIGADPEATWLRSTESLGDATVRSYTLPHPKAMNDDEEQQLSGPLGWMAHQGFIVYRADRLIVPGGWLGTGKPSESLKLARITIDLPNSADLLWGLNVMKSKIAPPAVHRGDLERIAAAARSNALSSLRFHGERVAPSVVDANEKVPSQAFWKQITGTKDVYFRINEGHPLVEALIHSVGDKAVANAFIRSFERLIPVAAILQQPVKATHGIAQAPDPPELLQLATAATLAIEVFEKAGHSRDSAIELTLSCHPFLQNRDTLRPLIKKQ